jgi:hypothetical protein
VTDLSQRVPGQSLIEELLRQWDAGTIRLEPSWRVEIDDEALSWYLGVLGERRVAERLSSLDEGWTVLHSVPVGNGMTDIDHLVIGRTGVYTINAKYSAWKPVWVAGFGMFVGGTKVPYVSRSMAEARRASDLLSRAVGAKISVTSIIAFVDPSYISQKAPPGDGIADVRVVEDHLVTYEFGGSYVYTEEQVARLVRAAVRPETWHRSPTASRVGSHIEAEFDALRSEFGPSLDPRPLTYAPSQPSSKRFGGTPRTSPARKSPARAPRGFTGTGYGRRPRSRRSSPERLMAEFGVPIAILVGVLWWANSISGK